MLYAEDLEPGRVFTLGTWEMTSPDIVRFAADWDPLPIHVDEAAAAASPFGGLIASGLHTMCIANRLVYDGLVSQLAVHAGRGVDELRLPKAVRPGAVLTASVEILERTPRDDGLVRVEWRTQLVDDEGDAVIRYVLSLLVRPRPA